MSSSTLEDEFSRIAWASMPASQPPSRNELIRRYLDRAAGLKLNEQIELAFESFQAASLFRFSLMNRRKSHPRGAEIQVSVRSRKPSDGPEAPAAKVILTRLPLPIGEAVTSAADTKGATSDV